MAQESRSFVSADLFDSVFSQVDVQLANGEKSKTVVLGQVFEREPGVEAWQVRQYLLPDFYLNCFENLPQNLHYEMEASLTFLSLSEIVKQSAARLFKAFSVP